MYLETRVSMLPVGRCGTDKPSHDWTLAVHNSNDNWKHFCLGVNWPRW